MAGHSKELNFTPVSDITHKELGLRKKKWFLRCTQLGLQGWQENPGKPASKCSISPGTRYLLSHSFQQPHIYGARRRWPHVLVLIQLNHWPPPSDFFGHLPAWLIRSLLGSLGLEVAYFITSELSPKPRISLASAFSCPHPCSMSPKCLPQTSVPLLCSLLFLRSKLNPGREARSHCGPSHSTWPSPRGRQHCLLVAN
jgi:hypothetical protein